ncbi:MAG: hypothetical protein EBW96_04185 [Actinobacteria bacterium]|nr:hypothetical protein [Actinomycetota bacterium]
MPYCMCHILRNSNANGVTDMQVTSIHTSCFAGANRAPTAGFVTFSDGKSYDWMVHPIDGHILFHTDRRYEGYSTSVSFQSAKRAAAVIAALNL